MRFAISKPKFGLCRIECICVCTDCPLSCLLYFVCRWPTHPPWTVSMAQAALCDITPQTRIPTPTNLTRAPPASSALVIPFRASVVQLRARLYEAWLAAQHDTGSESLAAGLNAIADELADQGAQLALPYTAPWPHLYDGRVLATHRGQLILGPRRASETIAREHQEYEYAQHFPPPQRAWSSTDLVAALETASVPPRAVHIVMLHRLLSVQRHPPGYGGVVCPYRHLAYADITSHLLRQCPAFFLHHLTTAWCFLQHPLVLPLLLAEAGSTHLIHGVSVCTPRLHVGLISGLHDARPPPQATRPRASSSARPAHGASTVRTPAAPRCSPCSEPPSPRTTTTPWRSLPPACSGLWNQRPNSGDLSQSPFRTLCTS